MNTAPDIRCPNCGAPLRVGQQALDCTYCGSGTTAAEAVSKPDKPVSKATVADKADLPPKSHTLKFTLAWLATIGLNWALGFPEGIWDTLFTIVNSFFFIMIFVSLYKNSVRRQAERRRKSGSLY